jgi:hypothetical protein
MTWQPFVAAVVMSLVAWLISRTLYRRRAPSMKRVGIVLLVSSLIMTGLGVLLFIGLYAAQSDGLAALLFDDPIAGAFYFLKLGLLTGFFWMPILLFTALTQARRVPYPEKTDQT